MDGQSGSVLWRCSGIFVTFQVVVEAFRPCLLWPRSDFSEPSRLPAVICALRPSHAARRRSAVIKLASLSSNASRCAFFSQPSVAHLGVAKAPLHVQERMLHFRPDRRFALLRQRLVAARLPVPSLAGPHRHSPLHIQLSILQPLVHSLIPRIPPHSFLSTVQQSVRFCHIMHVSWRRSHAVYHSRLSVSAYVYFHPEAPLVPLLRLVHLRVSLTRMIDSLVRSHGRGDWKREIIGAGKVEERTLRSR